MESIADYLQALVRLNNYNGDILVKSFFKFGIALVLITGSTFSQAYWDNRAQGKIKQIIVESSRVVVELVPGAVSRGQNCHAYMNINRSSPHFNEMYAMALTAMSADITFKLHFSPCNSGERPSVGATRLLK